jgi:ribosome assembly protein 4
MLLTTLLLLFLLLLAAGVVQVWDIHTRKLKVELPGHADEVYAVDWSPDGATVASGGKDQVVKLWRH